MVKEDSSSSSSSFINERKYDVFLSFRGLDTRAGFTGNVHKALRGKEIKSFMDDKDLEKGSEINPALDKAIQNSRIALVVLSKNYASSTSCLDELNMIMDCSKNKGMLVLPVFFEVEPSDVRYQKGTYADALKKHKTRIPKKEKIKKWRVALTKISQLSDWSSNDYRYEYELIDSIIECIIKMLRVGGKAKIICNVDDKCVTQHDKRVDVSYLNAEGKWEYQGTGLVSVDYLEAGDKQYLFVCGEKDNEYILRHCISSNDIYWKEEDRIISWRDPESAIDLALTFKEPSGCSYIWDHLWGVQKNMQFNNFNSGNSECFDKFSDDKPNLCSIV